MSLGVAGLPYIGMIIGVCIGLVLVVLANKSYVKKLRANNNIPVPEWRLPLPMFGGVIFALGFFWLGWGGYKASTPWIVPTLAGVFLGFGIYTVFIQCLNYVIDAYLMFAASVSAAALVPLVGSANNISLVRPSQQTQSCGPCSAPCSHYLQDTCSRVWASIGLVRYLAVLQLYSYLSRSFSSSKARLYV